HLKHGSSICHGAEESRCELSSCPAAVQVRRIARVQTSPPIVLREVLKQSLHIADRRVPASTNVQVTSCGCRSSRKVAEPNKNDRADSRAHRRATLLLTHLANCAAGLRAGAVVEVFRLPSRDR